MQGCSYLSWLFGLCFFLFFVLCFFGGVGVWKFRIMIICSVLTTGQGMQLYFMHDTSPSGRREGCQTSISWGERERGLGEREKKREGEGTCVWEWKRERASIPVGSGGVFMYVCVLPFVCMLHNGDILRFHKWLHRSKTFTMTEEEEMRAQKGLLAYPAFNLECSWFIFIKCNIFQFFFFLFLFLWVFALHAFLF